MSRSYRKNPFGGVPYGAYRPYAKNLGNRLIRRVPDEEDRFPVKGNRWRYQFVNTWDIRDYWGYCSFEDVMRRKEREYAEAVENVEAGWRACYWRSEHKELEARFVTLGKDRVHVDSEWVTYPAGWIKNRWFNERCRKVYEAGPPDRRAEWKKFRKSMRK